MKYIIILLAVCLFMGCVDTEDFLQDKMKVLKFDGCEYLYSPFDRGVAFTHKGNCTNPFHKKDTAYVAMKTDTIVLFSVIDEGDMKH